MPIHRAGGGVFPPVTPSPASPPIGPYPPIFIPEPILGPPGISAFTELLASFVMPPADDTTQVVVAVKDASWVGIGQPLFIENAGVLTAMAVTDTSIHLVNSGTSGNVSPGTVIPDNSKVSPSGVGGGGGGGGGGAITAVELVFVAGTPSNGSATPLRCGARSLSLAAFPASVGSLNRSIAFVVDIETTAGMVAAQLNNVTDVETVTGTALTTTNAANTELSSGPLVVGASAGDLKDNKSYEVTVSLIGGGPTDRAVLTNARLVITYA